MSVALYRRYRPKTFAEVTGQNHIKITLQNEIETGHLGHAYLFCGPRGTGKTTLARLVARAVNCENIGAKGEPCNTCPSCQEMLDSRAMDIIEIDAASHTGVDNIRENIIQNARFTPTKSKFKVFIIDEVHMLSISAFNALLKILEEPPKYVIFILATTEIHKLPATIISRCQRFDFRKVGFQDLVERLNWIISQEKVKVELKVLELIAKYSSGCVRDAESLLEQILSFGGDNITLEQAELILPRHDNNLYVDFLELLIEKKTSECFSFINKIVADGIDTNDFVENFTEFVRKVLVYKLAKDESELVSEFEQSIVEKIKSLINKISEQNLVEIITRLFINRDIFKQSYLPQLGLEMAVVDLTGDSVKPLVKTNKTEEPKSYPPPQEIKPKEIPAPTPKPIDSIIPKVAEEVNPLPAIQESEVLCEVKEQIIMDVGDIETIMQIWPSVLDKIKDNHYSVYMSLYMSKPISFVENVLTLGFLFEIQKRRIDESKSREAIISSLKEVSGQLILLETKLDSSLKLNDFANNGSKRVSTVDDSVSNIANEFGGQIVENI